MIASYASSRSHDEKNCSARVPITSSKLFIYTVYHEKEEKYSKKIIRVKSNNEKLKKKKKKAQDVTCKEQESPVLLEPGDGAPNL